MERSNWDAEIIKTKFGHEKKVCYLFLAPVIFFSFPILQNLDIKEPATHFFRTSTRGILNTFLPSIFFLGAFSTFRDFFPRPLIFFFAHKKNIFDVRGYTSTTSTERMTQGRDASNNRNKRGSRKERLNELIVMAKIAQLPFISNLLLFGGTPPRREHPPKNFLEQSLKRLKRVSRLPR